MGILKNYFVFILLLLVSPCLCFAQSTDASLDGTVQYVELAGDNGGLARFDSVQCSSSPLWGTTNPTYGMSYGSRPFQPQEG